MATKTTAFTGPVVVGLNDKKGEIRLTDGKNVNEAKYLSIAAPDTITSNTTLTFPNGAGTNGQVLTTDGNGGLSWSTGGGSGGSPGGTVGQTQVNDGAGGFGAISEGTSGQVLTSRGAGLAPTFQNATGGGIAAVVDDTSPELGGDLASNGFNINFADNNEAKFGDGTDLRIYHDGVSNHSYIKESGGGSLIMNTNNLVVQNAAGTANLINAPEGTAGLDLYYDGNIKLSTSSTGIQTTGSVNVNGAYSLPTSDGTANQVLKTDGAGNVTFQDDTGQDPFTGSLDIDTGQTIKLNANYPTGATTNVIMGENALTGGSIAGGLNTVIGSGAGNNSALTNGSRTTIVGANSGAGAGSSNTIVGADTLKNNVYGNCVVVGARAVTAGQNVQRCVAMGYEAGFDNDATNDNTIIGYQAYKDGLTGSFNTMIGSLAGENTNPDRCTYVGYEAGNTATGDNNTMIGYESGEQVTGADNTFVGYQTAMGGGGQGNTCVGKTAGGAFLGGDNNTCVGQDAAPSTNSADNEVTLGNSSITTLRCQVTSISSLSDARDKKDVEDVNVGLDFINDLRPVKFVWDTRDGAKKDIKEVGFIAQELDEVQQKHGIEDHLQLVLKNNPDKLEASQGKLIPILVQAIKDLKKEIDELKKA